MDKITNVAFLLYHSSDDPEIKRIAVDLLNGETGIRELKADAGLLNLIENAETALKKNPPKKEELQKFVEDNLWVEV